MSKGTKQPKLISNRKVRFDYDIKDTLIVGIQLSGAETKAVRQGQANLRGSYVNILKGELWLINASISGSNAAPIDETNKTRTRKLLAKSSEIKKLSEAKDQGLSIVALELLTSGRYIKLKIATAHGKKNYDKRNALKERDEIRKIQRYKHSS